MTKLTHARLIYLLEYVPETGEWLRRVPAGGRNGRKFPAGSKAGSRTDTGYWEVSIDWERFLGHRLAFFYMTGKWPAHQIDHRDRNPGNDSWQNLRPATQAENNANQGVPSHNASGLKGVMFDKRAKSWRSFATENNRYVHLGYYDCPAAASLAYQVHTHKRFGSFARAF